MLSRRRCDLVVVAAVLGVAAADIAASWSDIPGDFLVYRYACSAALRGVNVYAHDVSGPHVAGMPFTYPPFASIALLPTTWGPWRVAYAVWTLLSLGVLGFVLARCIPSGVRHRPFVIAAALAAAGTTSVLIDNVREGQVNVLLMGLCLADLHRRDRSGLPRGVLVGVAAATKLTPALFLLYFLITRQWRALRGGLVGAAVATLSGVVVYPQASATFFRSALWTLADRVDLGHPLGYRANASLTGLLTGAGLGVLALPTIVAFAGAALIAARRAHDAGREHDAWLVVGLAAPLVAPYSWPHHHVFLLPALVVLALRRQLPPFAVAGALAVLHFGPPKALVLLALVGIVLLGWSPSARRPSVRWRNDARRPSRAPAFAEGPSPARRARDRARRGRSGDRFGALLGPRAGAFGVRGRDAGGRPAGAVGHLPLPAREDAGSRRTAVAGLRWGQDRPGR